MFCINCGARLTDVSFCQACGEKVAGKPPPLPPIPRFETPQLTPKPMSNLRRRLQWVYVAVMIVFGVGGILAYLDNSAEHLKTAAVAIPSVIPSVGEVGTFCLPDIADAWDDPTSHAAYFTLDSMYQRNLRFDPDDSSPQARFDLGYMNGLLDGSTRHGKGNPEMFRVECNDLLEITQRLYRPVKRNWTYATQMFVERWFCRIQVLVISGSNKKLRGWTILYEEEDKKGNIYLRGPRFTLHVPDYLPMSSTVRPDVKSDSVRCGSMTVENPNDAGDPLDIHYICKIEDNLTLNLIHIGLLQDTSRFLQSLTDNGVMKDANSVTITYTMNGMKNPYASTDRVYEVRWDGDVLRKIEWATFDDHNILRLSSREKPYNAQLDELLSHDPE